VVIEPLTDDVVRETVAAYLANGRSYRCVSHLFALINRCCSLF